MLAVAAALLDVVDALRRGLPAAALARNARADAGRAGARRRGHAAGRRRRSSRCWCRALLTLAIVTPLGPLVYRLAYQRLADATVLVLLIVSVGVHFALTGLGLVFFGAEGFRNPSFWDAALHRSGRSRSPARR